MVIKVIVGAVVYLTLSLITIVLYLCDRKQYGKDITVEKGKILGFFVLGLLFPITLPVIVLSKVIDWMSWS